MKRILNLNHFALQWIAAIGVFCLGIPGVLGALSFFARAAGRPQGLFLRGIWVSLSLGGILLVGLVVLILVEQIQDELLYQLYRQGRRKRIPLGKGAGASQLFECPYCGNRQVRAFESTCSVCGNKLS